MVKRPYFVRKEPVIRKTPDHYNMKHGFCVNLESSTLKPTTTMGLFDFLKKTPAPQTTVYGPYKENSTNVLYHLLFCDNLNLYKTTTQQPYNYPFNTLFSEDSSVADLQKIVDKPDTDPRVKVLAYNKLLESGHTPAKKEILAIIVEVGLDSGLDVLASFNNGSARYINHTGRMLIWETTTDETSNKLTEDLFLKSRKVVDEIGPWDKPRRPHPTQGNARVTFLVSDGLYFGESTADALFKDPLAGAALNTATQLMLYITEKSLEKEKA